MNTSNILIENTNNQFIIDNPRGTIDILCEYQPSDCANFINTISNEAVKILWPLLPSAVLDKFSEHLADETISELCKTLDPIDSARLLNSIESAKREVAISTLNEDISKEIIDLLKYPENSAGKLMSSNFHTVHENVFVKDIINQIRVSKKQHIRTIYVVDGSQKLLGYIYPYKLLSANEDEHVQSILNPVRTTISDFTTREEIIELLQKKNLHYLPVINTHDQLIGIIDATTLIEEVKDDISADLQTMVGVSKDERALSSSWFTVKKRLLWLEINLFTAFLAAAVVGFFEPLIAQYTALAVLLPVVAGQSGNAGAQALAVTMRGLTLKEISTKKWLLVTMKEAKAGFVNGLAIAVTCMFGVYIWSKSVGLMYVIGISMVIAMTVACVSGAIIPILLKKMNLDPASSSSIVLTTITDVSGFFAFLGIASFLSKIFSL